jgi:hypothetical protein
MAGTAFGLAVTFMCDRLASRDHGFEDTHALDGLQGFTRGLDDQHWH